MYNLSTKSSGNNPLVPRVGLRRNKTTLSYDKANHLIERPKIRNEVDREEYYELKHKHILKSGDDILRRWIQAQDQKYQKKLEEELKYYSKKFEEEFNERCEQLEIDMKRNLKQESAKIEKKYETMFEEYKIKLAKEEERRKQELINQLKQENIEALKRQAEELESHLERTINDVKKEMRIEVYNEAINNKDKEVQEDLERLFKEFSLREEQAIKRTREECIKESEEKIKDICKCYDESLEILMLKAKNSDDKWKEEKLLREKIEHDFRLLQTCFKRFINYTGQYNSDYMMKLRHIGQNIISDNEYEEKLDLILKK